MTNVNLCSFAQASRRRRRSFECMIRSAPPAPIKTALITLAIAVVIALLVSQVGVSAPA